MDRSATGWRAVSFDNRLSPSAESFRARLLRDLLARAPERRKTMARRRAVRKAALLPPKLAAQEEGPDIVRELVRNIPQALWVRDVATNTIQYVSPAWHHLTGRSLAVGDRHEKVFTAIDPEDRQRVVLEAQKAPEGGVDCECRLARQGGRVRWVRMRTFSIGEAAGKACRVAGSMEDVTERREADERLLKLAHCDALTGLPNRVRLHEMLRVALTQAGDSVVSVLFIDIDHFKRINDTLGHAFGDDLLRQIGRRLLTCLRVRDAVGRLGGDEFVLILVTSDRPRAAEAVAEKIRRVLRRPFELEGRPVTVTASIGIAVGKGASDPDSLIKHADMAMYEAKQCGRDTHRFYEVGMTRSRRELGPGGRPRVRSPT
jgi:diguanylate cyclase (GGDEF)-like protein/PAS domain S-box-containing protein